MSDEILTDEEPKTEMTVAWMAAAFLVYAVVFGIYGIFQGWFW